MIFYTSPIEIVRHFFGIEPQSLVHIGQSRIIIGIVQHFNNSPLSICSRYVFIYRNSFIYIINRFYRIALLQIELGPTHITVVIVRMQSYEFIETFFGFVIFFQLHFGNSLIIQKRPIFGGITQTLGIVVDSALIIPKILSGNPPNLIGIDNKRITFDTKGTIFFCPFKIIEAQLRNSSIKIRLGHIRLYLYYLIEILHRQNIVLKIKCITSDIHHSIGINLRHR